MALQYNPTLDLPKLSNSEQTPQLSNDNISYTHYEDYSQGLALSMSIRASN